MAACEDALRVIERLDGFWLYGAKISVSFVQREIKRQVCGVVDNVKVQVLQTYAVGWCGQPLSITRLAREMQSAGFRGIELMWDTCSMELLCFKTMEAIVEGPLSWHNGMW
ncbi:hypothetical protein V6N11_082038 [Hibiscus sabdariffa]|uniref:Uncharacterized protein n=2 Tax=Hibiscus sabdariffa TaxID=183260 RepID=A0ABR2QH80_9ROSI